MTAGVIEVATNQMLDDAVRRLDNLRDVEAKHSQYVSDLRADYEQRLSVAESARINANRETDISAVAAANAVSITQATTLANQVAVSADAMRTSLANALDPIQKDIADLRRVQYEQQGQKTQQTTQEITHKAGINTGWVIAGVVISAIVGIIGIGVTIALTLYVNGLNTP